LRGYIEKDDGEDEDRLCDSSLPIDSRAYLTMLLNTINLDGFLEKAPRPTL